MDMDDIIRVIGVYKRVLMIVEKNWGFIDELLVFLFLYLGYCLLEEGRVDEVEFVLFRWEVFYILMIYYISFWLILKCWYVILYVRYILSIEYFFKDVFEYN